MMSVNEEGIMKQVSGGAADVLDKQSSILDDDLKSFISTISNVSESSYSLEIINAKIQEQLMKEVQVLEKKLEGFTFREDPMNINTTKVLLNILKKKRKNYHHLPQLTFDDILTTLDDEIEQCHSLIALKKDQIKRKREKIIEIRKHRKILNEMDKTGEQKQIHKDITSKIKLKFKEVKGYLEKIVELWAGDKIEDCIQVLAILTNGHLNEENAYVDVQGCDPEVVRMLVATNMVKMNDSHTKFKLSI